MSSTPILTAPEFVKSLPASQRQAFAPKASEIKQAAVAFVEKLKAHRNEWARAATNVVSTSSIYEAFREAGCEARVVRKVDEKTGQPLVERRMDSKGQPKDYPVCDIYVMLPDGPIQNRSGRKPWTPPKQRLATLRAELEAKDTTAERKAEIREAVKVILERNPGLS